MFKLAVISRAHDEEVLIEAHIRSLFAQALELVGLAEVQFHIVANGCTDDTVATAKRIVAELRDLPGITWTIHDIPKASSTASLNWGIEHSQSEFIVVTDADTTMGPRCILKVLSCLNRPGVHLAGATHDTIVPLPLRDRGIGYLSRTHTIIGEVAGFYPLPVAAMTAYRRSLLQHTGLYDEVMVSCDDTRLVLKVVTLFGPDSVVVHSEAFVYTAPPADVLEWMKMRTRHRRGHARMLETEPQLVPASRWRQDLLSAMHARAETLKPQILARMEQEGIPIEMFLLLFGPIAEVIAFLSVHEPVQVDMAGHWPSPKRVAVTPV